MGDASHFVPTTRQEMEARGWQALDVLIVSGDAYVDHPAFGPALIARVLEAQGHRVGLIAQPRWQDTADIARMGRPRLMVGVSAGNLDSMLNKLTAQKKVRSEELYSPGGEPNLRPNRATIVYANLCRQAFPGLPVILGGIEASLRRVAHYDYWADEVRRSILLDAKADLLIFGMAERAVTQVASRLAAGEPIAALRDVRGSACVLDRASWKARLDAGLPQEQSPVVLPSYDEVKQDRRAFAMMTRLIHLESNPLVARPLLQVHGDQAVWLNPPALGLNTSELDAIYDLPFARRAHPSYREPVPALKTVQHSIAASRGCFGGCSFCAITCHEGRSVQSRSSEALEREARTIARQSGFRGTLTDIGGPTANMYGLGCKSERAERVCRRLSCLHPTICQHLDTDHGDYIRLLRKLRAIPAVSRVYIASGIRFDLALRSPQFVRELAAHHTGGQLSIAPEHVCAPVLAAMRKPAVEQYERFAEMFHLESERAGKRQFLIPYFIVGHPGSTLEDTIELALYLKRNELRPRQVQEFIPTPMTLATAMYHTGLDPMTLRPVQVVRGLRDKRMMKALLMYWDEAQWPLAREALAKAGRKDLIGNAPACLVPSRVDTSSAKVKGLQRSSRQRRK
ncbi:MAG: YgiQ family radical SAM protein [Deltaproteobacteria bacterium]|nr:YgiQ family radical SAM protein [Deltaproteobacteria bacterium]